LVFPRATTFRPARTTTVAPPIGDGVPVVKKAATIFAFFLERTRAVTKRF
jgi:hypothetical protein